MKPGTKKLLKELEKSEWFAAVGQPTGTAEVSQVSSWAEAIKACRSRISEEVAVEAINVLTRCLHERANSRYQRWNEILKSIKKVLTPIVRTKTRVVIRFNRLPKAFEARVHWDLFNACMEEEFAEVVPPRYFAVRAQWYIKGHFPCGWKGEFPEGRLVVF